MLALVSRLLTALVALLASLGLYRKTKQVYKEHIDEKNKENQQKAELTNAEANQAQEAAHKNAEEEIEAVLDALKKEV